MSLALEVWVSAGHGVLISGPTGAGKSWPACALAQYASRRGYSAIYHYVPSLQEELRIRHGSKAVDKWLVQLAKTNVLVLASWGMGAIDSKTSSDLRGAVCVSVNSPEAVVNIILTGAPIWLPRCHGRRLLSLTQNHAVRPLVGIFYRFFLPAAPIIAIP